MTFSFSGGKGRGLAEFCCSIILPPPPRAGWICLPARGSSFPRPGPMLPPSPSKATARKRGPGGPSNSHRRSAVRRQGRAMSPAQTRLYSGRGRGREVGILHFPGEERLRFDIAYENCLHTGRYFRGSSSQLHSLSGKKSPRGKRHKRHSGQAVVGTRHELIGATQASEPAREDACKGRPWTR